MRTALSQYPPADTNAGLWEARLLGIRTRAWNGIQSAQRFIRFFCVGALILCGLALLQILMFSSMVSISSYSADEVLLTILPIGVVLAVGGFFLNELVRAPEIYNSTYTRYSQEFASMWPARLFVDEELHHLLQVGLDRAAILNHGVVRKARSFEQQIEFCACHLESLKRLERDPEAHLLRRDISRATNALRLQSWFSGKSSQAIIYGCLALLFLRTLAVILMIYAMFMAKHYIASRAVIVALIDYMLERTDEYSTRS